MNKEYIERALTIVKDKFVYLVIFLYYFLTLLYFMSDPKTRQGDYPRILKMVDGDNEILLIIDSFKQTLSYIFNQGAIHTRYPQLFFDMYFSHHIIIFILITSLLAVLLLRSFLVITCAKRTVVKVSLIFSMLLFFPIMQMQSAGYFATVVDYFWPLALFVYWISVVVQTARETTVKKVEYILPLFALLIAVFEQQICFMTLAILIYVLLYKHLLKNSQTLKQHIGFYIVSALFSLFGIINVIFSPATVGRQIAESEAYFPAFSTLSLPRKFDGVFQIMSKYYFLDGNMVVFVIVLLLCLTLFWQRKFVFGMLNSVLIFFLIPPAPLSESFKGKHFWTGMLNDYLLGIYSNSVTTAGTGYQEDCENCGIGYISQTSLNHPSSFIPDLFYVSVIIIIVLSMFIAYGKSIETLHIYFCILIAFLSLTMMIASPTILASHDRPFIFGQIFLVFVVFIQFRFLLNNLFNHESGAVSGRLKTAPEVAS